MIKNDDFKQGDTIAAHDLPFDEALKNAGCDPEQIAKIKAAQAEQEEMDEKIMTLTQAQCAVENILHRLHPESHEIKVNFVRGEAYEMEVRMNIPIRPDADMF